MFLFEKFFILNISCKYSNFPSDYNIRHSSTNLLYGVDENVIQVAEVITHPNYNPVNRYIHDIAVLRVSIYCAECKLLVWKVYTLLSLQLERPINIAAFAILPQQFEDVAQDVEATLIGWGLDETGGTVQTTLQEVSLIIFSDEECARRHSNGPPHQSNICGGVPEGGMGQCSVSHSFYNVMIRSE